MSRKEEDGERLLIFRGGRNIGEQCEGRHGPGEPKEQIRGNKRQGPNQKARGERRGQKKSPSVDEKNACD